MSTYQPQPGVCGEPSRSQPWLAGTTLHRTVVTTPEEAAWIGVPRAAPRSTPSWPGRLALRKPDTTRARTGATQPSGGTPRRVPAAMMVAAWPTCSLSKRPTRGQAPPGGGAETVAIGLAVPDGAAHTSPPPPPVNRAPIPPAHSTTAAMTAAATPIRPRTLIAAPPASVRARRDRCPGRSGWDRVRRCRCRCSWWLLPLLDKVINGVAVGAAKPRPATSVAGRGWAAVVAWLGTAGPGPPAPAEPATTRVRHPATAGVGVGAPRRGACVAGGWAVRGWLVS